MRVGTTFHRLRESCLLTSLRIVEYATSDEAQNAVNTLSNQTLMGRLIYVREVRSPIIHMSPACSHYADKRSFFFFF